MLAEDKQRGHSNAALLIRRFNAATEKRTKDVGAIVVDSGGQSSGLPQRPFIRGDIFVIKDPRAKGRRSKHLIEPPGIIRSSPPLGQARQLEKEHIPTRERLTQRHV